VGGSGGVKIQFVLVLVKMTGALESPLFGTRCVSRGVPSVIARLASGQCEDREDKLARGKFI
jgi:hypothetical protein